MLKIKIGDFHKNSGIIGLTNILDDNATEGVDYQVTDEGLEISEDFFTKYNFGELYINTLLKRNKDSVLTKWMDDVETYRQTKDKALRDKALKIRVLERKLCWTTAADVLPPQNASELISFAYRGYAVGIIKDKFIDTKKYGIKLPPKITGKENISQAKEKLAMDVYEWLQNEENFNACQISILLKDVISKFWVKAPLLESSKGIVVLSKRIGELGSYAAAYNEAFVDAVQNYESKGKLQCIDCGAALKSKSKGVAVPITFTNNIWNDMQRKTSAFWNYNAEAYLCPLCALVYSCAPLGFIQYGRDFLFINSSLSMKDLINERPGKNEHKETNETYAHWFNRVRNIVQKDASRTLSGVQVIIMQENSNYRFVTITKPVAEIIRQSEDALEALASKNIWASHNNNYINIYGETAKLITNLQDVYQLCDLCIRADCIAKSFAVNQLINVQISILNTGGRLYMTNEELRKRKNIAYYDGLAFKEAYMRTKGTDNIKIMSGIIHPLLNSVSVSDGMTILDKLLRAYAYLGMAVPETITRMGEKSEEAKAIGYAYISGLLGERKEKKNVESK